MAIDSSSQRVGTSISQINVTPLVDVMLVLLIIFMVTAPIIQQGVQVELPQAKVGALPGSEQQLVVTITRKGKVFLNDNSIVLAKLGEKLQAIRKLQPNKEVYVRADRNVRYGIVLKAIAEITRAGLKLGLVGDPIVTKKG